jgi:hypothetical protein
MHPLATTLRKLALIVMIGASPAVVSAKDTHVAISAFNSWCFKAGQTPAQARANMERTAGAPLPFVLTFWDDSLAPRPADAPKGVERRCEVRFDGDHTEQAIHALHKQMQTPPVFGTLIALPATHAAIDGTALIEGRALLRGRVAVVHVGTDGAQTFMAVDRLYSDWEES